MHCAVQSDFNSAIILSIRIDENIEKVFNVQVQIHWWRIKECIICIVESQIKIKLERTTLETFGNIKFLYAKCWFISNHSQTQTEQWKRPKKMKIFQKKKIEHCRRMRSEKRLSLHKSAMK